MSEQQPKFTEVTEAPKNQQLQSDELLNVTPIEDVEWCYQFFDNEPVVFGFSQEEQKAMPLVIQLRPVVEDVLTFTQNGMSFKIFPRPITEETKELRNQQKQSEENEG